MSLNILRSNTLYDDDVVLKIDDVSKKFCRSLKRSMFYGAKDTVKNMLGISQDFSDLRQGEFWALKNVQFELKKGETLGIIGQNGCGKTTLLRLVNGIFPPSQGKVTVKGRVGALIAVGAGFHPHMTGRENIFLNGSILGMTRREIRRKFDSIVDFAEIGEFIDAPVSTYSSGMYVRLGFAIAIHADIDLLLVDEILAVGDLGFILKCFNKIGELKRNGVSILYVSHDMQGIINMSDSVLFLHKGIVQFYGNPSKAISLYKKTFSEVFTSEGEIERVTNGNQYFKALDISFNYPLIDNKLSMHSNEDLIVRIMYESDVDYDDILFDICMRIPIPGPYFMQTTNRALSKTINLKKGRGLLEAVIKKVTLNNIGMYLDLAIWDKGRTEMLFWNRNFPVYVEGNASSSGFSFFEIDYRCDDILS